MKRKADKPPKKRQPRTARDRAIQIGSKQVPNPHFNPAHVGASANPKRIVASVNVRESAVATMASRGLLDDAQVEAADRFRRLFETLGGSGAGAMDYSKEVVDGGGAVEHISEAQIGAGLELAGVQGLLGRRGYDLVSKVCGQGLALIEVSANRRGRDTAADNLRDHLDDLATAWGLAVRRGAGFAKDPKAKPGPAGLGRLRGSGTARGTFDASVPIDTAWAEKQNDVRRQRAAKRAKQVVNSQQTRSRNRAPNG